MCWACKEREPHTSNVADICKVTGKGGVSRLNLMIIVDSQSWVAGVVVAGAPHALLCKV